MRQRRLFGFDYLAVFGVDWIDEGSCATHRTALPSAICAKAASHSARSQRLEPGPTFYGRGISALANATVESCGIERLGAAKETTDLSAI
jgi:hypothetical protein